MTCDFTNHYGYRLANEENQVSIPGHGRTGRDFFMLARFNPSRNYDKSREGFSITRMVGVCGTLTEGRIN